MDTTRVRENGTQAISIDGAGTLNPEERRLVEVWREGPVNCQYIVVISGQRPVKVVRADTVVKLQEVITHE